MEEITVYVCEACGDQAVFEDPEEAHQHFLDNHNDDDVEYGGDVEYDRRRDAEAEEKDV